jgi:hypothetical protein
MAVFFPTKDDLTHISPCPSNSFMLTGGLSGLSLGQTPLSVACFHRADSFQTNCIHAPPPPNLNPPPPTQGGLEVLLIGGPTSFSGSACFWGSRIRIRIH